MTPRRIELGLDLLTGLIVVSVAVALAGMTWRLLGEPGGASRAAPPAAAAPPPLPPLDLAPVVQLAPFGSAAVPAGAGGAAAMGLQLRGVVRADPASASTALISTGAGPAQPFAVGQSLAAGATVDSIAVDQVTLRIAGRLETLGFPDKHAAAARGPAGSGVEAIRAAIPASVSGLAPAGPTPVEVYRDRVSGGAPSLLASLGATPTSQGYKVGSSPSADMRAAGLQPGDIVRTVNGVALGDPDRDRQVFDQAVVSGRARVEVLRDGRSIVMSFPLR